MNGEAGSKTAAAWELTGNHFVALPCIALSDGSIDSLNVLHRGALGAIEWSGRPTPATGAPLLQPMVEVDGEPVPLGALTWERLERWVPRFRARLSDQLSLSGTICAPSGYDANRRGAIYTFEIENRGAGSTRVRIALRGVWGYSFLAAGSRRLLACTNRVIRAAAADAVVLEIGGSVSAAIAAVVYGSESNTAAVVGERTLERGEEASLANGEPITFLLERTVEVASHKRATITFYLGIAPEREGALYTAAALRRAGQETLLRETRLDLSRLIRRTSDPALTAVLNRNLLFSYFFGVGRALDDERIHPVTSRSTLHSRCATYNERDSLLWALPALAIADGALAREVLLRCFEQHTHRAGESVHYIDGGVQRPGFALDQWAAYGVGLELYARITGDETIYEEALVADVVRELEGTLYHRLHPEVFLARTELLPSGDAADHPFTTYGNALLAVFCRVAQRVLPEGAPERARLANAAEELTSAIWRRCTADLEDGPVLSWSTDLTGAAAIYDDPAGSLQLLPFYGFCADTEPLWRETMQFLRSSAYPLWLGSKPFGGLASRSAPRTPALAGLCTELVGGDRRFALELLRKMPLDRGLATSHYDPDTGAARGEQHDAGLAGWLAWSLHQALTE